ncbi:hypothetical protein MSMEI_3204 [Mycolicibacterium smegmatis MC2 155]|uniref:Uncharacterized protein n=1 Tax=Mycolicibacterium smegmatis (strain ATCC 700084 / mc(2)155) TaxID=246196 RepID=I7G1K8_MYCS2|nr:hypothetical protein MSMEI_3204 [Mycolicibacterium smegmatis MC2 155]
MTVVELDDMMCEPDTPCCSSRIHRIHPVVGLFGAPGVPSRCTFKRQGRRGPSGREIDDLV